MQVMNGSLYYAAARGLLEDFEGLEESLDRVVTIKNSTILHIYITSLPVQRERPVETTTRCRWTGFSIVKLFVNFARRRIQANLTRERHNFNIIEEDASRFVEKILNKCPALVAQTNDKGETPLHIAARYGHHGIARALLDRSKAMKNGDPESGGGLAKQMLRMTTANEKDTPLHEAVRFNHTEMVKTLTNEDPKFAYFANRVGETPLYMAVERGCIEAVEEIMRTCKSVAYHGPSGRTALHAAVYCHSIKMTTVVRDGVLEKMGIDLAEEADDQGWIPLHYAAYFGDLSMVQSLLDSNKMTAYIREKKGQKTALLIAASCGREMVVQELLLRCPDCCELIDKRGQNVLHIMMSYCVNTALPQTFCFSNLLNEKDVDGNTPLHVCANNLFWVPHIIYNPRVDLMAFNHKNFNAMDIAVAGQGILEIFKRCLLRELKELGLQPSWPKVDGDDKIDEEKRKDTEKNKQKDDNQAPDDLRYTTYTAYNYKLKAKNYNKEEFVKEMEAAKGPLLVVATLIATVTFAAGFTLPGGYKSDEGPDQGSAILTRNAAFQAFVVADTIAMLFSSCAVFLHIYMATKDHFDELFKHFFGALCLTVFAMVAMVFAFVLGTYAVLAHSSALAISICILGCCFIAFFVWSLVKIE